MRKNLLDTISLTLVSAAVALNMAGQGPLALLCALSACIVEKRLKKEVTS